MSDLTPEQICRVLDVQFTAEQIAAITAPMAPSVVIAGAGSGKTTVMSARVVWLVASGLVTPDEVLGLTFTNKAAAELADRVRRALRRLAHSGFEVAEGTPTICTYHAYAAGLLREYGLHAGLEPSAQLIADASRFQIAERVVRCTAGPFEHLTGRVVELTQAVVGLDSELNEHLVDPAAVDDHDQRLVRSLEHLRAEARKLTSGPASAESTARARGELLEIVREFRREKLRRGVVDFGDQMASAALLAERHPVIVESERDRFPAVLLDEYQDTSIAQKRLLLALFGDAHAVTAVGDPFQAIYGWRGASVRNILDFNREFSADGASAAVLSLSRNNRSGERILDLANVLAEPLREHHPGVEPLHPRDDLEASGDVHVSLHQTLNDEIEWLSADIAGRVEHGEQPKSIAVLCRTAVSFGALHRSLVSRGVPVEVVGLTGLLELPEIADLVAVLQVLDDPGANPAMIRLLTGPRFRLGARDLALLGSRARSLVATTRHDHGDDLAASLQAAVAGIDSAEIVSLADAVHDPGRAPYSPEARHRLSQLDAELKVFRSRRSDSLLDLIRLILDTTGLSVESALASNAATVNRTDNLATFVSLAAGFVDLDGNATVSSFLAFLAASSEYEGGLDTAQPSSANTVKVMTVHKAKGLEWPTVYLPGMLKDSFPSTRGRSLWTTRAQVLPFTLRGDASDFPTVSDWSGNKGCQRFRREMADRDLVEERRLAYVAVTRAAANVLLSAHWWGPIQKRPRGPGTFLEEAHQHCLDGGGTVGVWEPEPVADSANPNLSAPAVAWPAELEPDAAAARRAGAELVRHAMTRRRDAEKVAEFPGALSPELSSSASALVTSWDEDLEALLTEVAIADRPQQEVRLPSTLSASGLQRLAKNPKSFARELARPMPRPPAPAARRGTTFHQWVETRFGSEPLIDLDALDDASPLSDTELTQLQAAFEAGPYADRLPLAIEAPFQLMLAGQVISGRIDAVYQVAGDDDGRWFEVIDWKTGRQKADPLQLAVYRLAWAELHGVPLERVRCAFYYVSRGVVEYHEDLPARDELEMMLAELQVVRSSA